MLHYWNLLLLRFFQRQITQTLETVLLKKNKGPWWMCTPSTPLITPLCRQFMRNTGTIKTVVVLNLWYENVYGRRFTFDVIRSIYFL